MYPGRAGEGSLVERVERLSEVRPEHQIYLFLAESGEEAGSLTLADLSARARAIAVCLQKQGLEGERALLLFPPGLAFISAFLGCLYAGVVAVPVAPPRRDRGLQRLADVAGDARPKAVLVGTSMLERARNWDLPGASEWAWLDVESVARGEAEKWRKPDLDPAALAFLQYTSGSTSVPKGVMVSHGNLVANLQLITAGFGQTESSVVVGWLPAHHDMGLIGNILQPLWSGSRCILMSPLTFLQKPVRWLEAISRYGATTSGGPSFSYELCAEKITDEQKAGLDLSRWSVAFNGAEPVRADTLDRFAAAFDSCSFRRQAFAPCFGLAEATLLVTVAGPDRGPRVASFSSADLEQGIAIPAKDLTVPSRRLVGCGTPPPGVDVKIVDPESGLVCPEGRVGELWVAGDSVTEGYWQRPELSAETFGAQLGDFGKGRYLRTGDLGFQVEGAELFVTGRLKDLIIIRGRNHYPQDIELTVERSHPSLRSAHGVAFSVESGGEERLVVVQEVERRSRVSSEELEDAIRQAVADQHDISVLAVVLLGFGSLPKTTSGKVQRRRCRDLFLRGELAGGGRGAAPRGAASPTGKISPTVAADLPRAEALAALREFVAQALRTDPAVLDAGRPLTAQGLDSLAAFEVGGRIEAAFGVAVDPADLLAGASLEEIVGTLSAHGSRLNADDRAIVEGTRELRPADRERSDGTASISRGQRAIWFMQRLEPQSAAYNLSAAFRVLSPLDLAAFERALGRLLARHDSLRSRFPVEDDEPVCRIVAEEVGVERLDVSSLSPAELAERLSAAAHLPFDLERGPLLRATLFESAEGATLLLSVHHIVVDFQSLAVVARDLGRFYESERRPGVATLPSVGGDLGRYVAWEELQATGLVGDKGWEYWRETLGGALPELDLPTDRPRPRHQRFKGGSRSLRLDGNLSSRVAALARGKSSTQFSILLAAFQILLHRHSGQDDVLVGIPASCREAARAGDLVGFLINPLVSRGRFTAADTFSDFLTQVHAGMVGALRHQGFPFPLLTERLAPARNSSRAPLFQAMFVLHRRRSEADSMLADLALGEPGVSWVLGDETEGLHLSSVPLEVRSSQLDLSLAVAESRSELALRLVFDSDLFDDATAERMLGHLRCLLAAAIEAPEKPVADLQLLSPTEEEQLASWNGTEVSQPSTLAVHDLFARQAKQMPAAVAVEWEGQELTYRELAVAAAAVTRRLRDLRIGPGSLVGLLVGRSPDLLAGILGILAAGSAVVPLDPVYPVRRIRLMARDSGIAALIVDPSTVGLFPDLDVKVLVLEQSASAVAAPVESAFGHPANIAYVLYTSGSTGRPKGVMVTHRGLANVLLAIGREAAMGPADRVLSFTTPSFDIGLLELLLPLVTGGRLILAPTETGRDGAALARAIAAHRPTLVQATPATWSLLLESPPPRDEGLKAFSGGEAMTDLLADGLRTLAGRAWNMYGPTETAVYSVIFDLAKGVGAPPIGRPVANTRCQVLSPASHRMPIGVPGELCIAGEGVARGYLGRADLTAERFLPDPFSPRLGERMYRTGDLARRRHDGEIEYLGRIDRQVKIRGYRIELGEIQERLRSHPEVRDAVVVAQADETGEKRLVAYFIGVTDQPIDGGDLAAFLREDLPEFMVPAFFVPLESFPLTPNGKVDDRSLPRPQPTIPIREDAVSRRSPVEEWVGEIWADVLGIGRVGAKENFFALGGHSLKAARVIARARKVFGVDLPLRSLFESPTLETFARQVEEARRNLVAGGVPIESLAASDDEISVASFGERRLWLMDRLRPGLSVYNMPLSCELHGSLSVNALVGAVGEIVRRHEVLRTCFPATSGEPVPVVDPAVTPGLESVDLSALSPAMATAEASHLAAREAARPFDLAAGPVLRHHLLWLPGSIYTLLLNVHHIVADGASLDLFVSELETLYAAFSAGRPSPLPPLPLRYRDYANWQRSTFSVVARDLRLKQWAAKLIGVEPLEMPIDNQRRGVQSFRGHRTTSLLPSKAAGPVSLLARREGMTPFVILSAAFALLLQRWARQRGAVVVGTPFEGRDRVELEPLIGLFVQLLPLRLHPEEGATGSALLHQVRDEVLTAWEHRDLPIELIVEEIQAHRSTSRAPLIQTTLSYERASDRPAGPLVTRVAAIDNGTTKFDLSLFACESADGLALTLEMSADLFDRTTAQRMVGHFERLLTGLAAAPEVPLAEISLLSDGERQQIAVEWNDTRTLPLGDAAEITACDLFEARARSFPDAAAVVTDQAVLTYGELDRRAGRLAGLLCKLGVGPESVVAILLPRSPELVLAVLAVAKAGAAYLPLDLQHPQERVQSMLEDSRARVLLTAAGSHQSASGFAGTELDIHRCLEESREILPSPLGARAPESLAYVVYTSGSTGRPKAVAISHRGLANLVSWHLRTYRVVASDRATLIAAPAFDASVWETWPYLCAGASLVPLSFAQVAAPAVLADELARLGTTFVFLPTPLAESLLAEPGIRRPILRALLTGGDRLRRGNPDVETRLMNHYGPTEATVVTSWAPVPVEEGSESAPAIGRPIDNLRTHVLDERGRPVPIGIPGELHVAGLGLARGYLGQPSATAERFIPSAFASEPGERLYRTGDLVRYLPDGRLEFVGRADRQVKIRGFRVEPGEIESRLLKHSGVHQAVVGVWEDRILGSRLAAFIVPRDVDARPSAGELRGWLKETLPDYMVPSAFRMLERLPQTSNGKVDLAALPPPEEDGPLAEGGPSQSPLEEILSGLWSELLGRVRIGTDDNFFELGGHSLQVARLQARIQEELGVELPLETIFRRPILGELAEEVAARLVAAVGEEAMQGLLVSANEE
ncbi:MAG: amino acid adenylation domain-containing protein [Acidobacteriota bacterium]